MKAALIGRDISYTLSPRVHEAIGRAVGINVAFDVLDVTFDRLEKAVAYALSEFDGFYVTVPYKTDIKRYIGCDFLGSINLVRSNPLSAFNTDGIGLVRALDSELNGWRSVDSVLILGAGGAAHAAATALKAEGKNVYVLGRTLMRAARLCNATGAELYANQNAELIINCTSVGASGDVLKSLCVLPDGFKFGYELCYSAVTPFMRRLTATGAFVADGMSMLIHQAIAGDGILTGGTWDHAEVYGKVRRELRS